MGLVLAGVVLILLSFIRAKLASHWPVLSLTAGLAIVLSEYTWEHALWDFWGEYWPDGYISMAQRISSWLSGTSTLVGTLDFISKARNGCNFLPSLLMREGFFIIAFQNFHFHS